MATSWTTAGIELLLKWCAGLETPPEKWVFGADVIIIGDLMSVYYPSTGWSRSAAITTYVTEEQANGNITFTGIDSGLGYDDYGTPYKFVKAQTVFDTTGLSVDIDSADKLHLSSSIEFTR